MSARRLLGDAGEGAVAGWYQQQGYAVVDRNWRVRAGEIDVIAQRGSTLVFCEVKTRRGTRFGTPAEAVTYTKQQRIRKVALEWLRAHGRHAGVLRFDVASVTFTADGGVLRGLSRVVKDALVVPQRAAFEVDDKRYVYVVDSGGVAHRQAIAVQSEVGDQFVVKSGVQANDRVIVEGVRLVEDGGTVQFDDPAPKKLAADPK